MWDDLSKISIALHKSGVPPRPRLNWTLGCLEILEQKRELVRALITVVTSFHIVCLTCAMLLTSLHLPFSLLLQENHHFSFDSHQYLCRIDLEKMIIYLPDTDALKLDFGGVYILTPEINMRISRLPVVQRQKPESCALWGRRALVSCF